MATTADETSADNVVTSPVSKKHKASEKPKLYSYWRSSCSWRVRIVLALKDIEYDYEAIHLVQDGGQQFSPSYTELCPNQRVPLLLIDGYKLSQSIAIVEYLEETRSSSAKLLPEVAIDKAQVRELCNLIGCDIQPVQNLAILKKVMALVEGEEEKARIKIQWGHDIIQRGFVALEARLKETAGKYCFGDDVTLADCFLVPQVYNAKRFKVDLSEFSTISRINDSLATLPAFIAAEPASMPDASA